MKKTNPWNRLLSLVLCICMVLSLISGIPLVVSAAANAVSYDGTPVTPSKITSDNYYKFGLTSSNWSGYNGYYGIRNAAELYGFANLVNGGNTGANAVLLQDITVNTGTVTSSGATYSWNPIGSNGSPYLGTFDGNGCTISGIYINGSGTCVGLFGVVGKLYERTGAVKDLQLSNSYICGSSSVGGIAGILSGDYASVSYCAVGSDVTVVATAEDMAYVGGICGNFGMSAFGNSSATTVSNCSVLGKVSAPNADYHIGALIGYYRSYSNALEYILVSNCFYVAGNTIRKGNVHDIGKGGTDTATNEGCTKLSSASDSHTCVSVTHQEVTATCQYPGRSQYSFCLICGKVTAGTKNEYAVVDHSYADANCVVPATCIYCGLTTGSKNPGNHTGTSKVYGVSAADRTQHDYKWACCSAVISTENHTFDSNQKCTLCGYICEHLKSKNGVCTGCGFVGVGYMDCYWDSESKQVVSKLSVAFEPKNITSDTTTLSSGWYVVNSNVTISNRLEVSGTVHLILADGCTLNASQGVQVTTGNALYIYGQVLGTGTLNASLSNRYHAAIGGYHTNMSDHSDGGTIVINGGNVTAKAYSYGAAIGGPSRGDFDQLTINGGTVTASNSGDGAAIGSGNQMSSGPITINGGYVSATQTDWGAAIGGGCDGGGGSVVINGGTVVAKDTDDWYGAAGIGGGRNGSGGDVVINGGSVCAIGGHRAQAIGQGSGGTSNGTLTDGNGNAVSCYTLTLEDGDISSIASVQGLGSYSLYDVQVLDTNKVYLYLADSAAPGYITIGDTIYCRGTSKDYSVNGHSAIGDWISDNGYHYKNCANGCGGKAKLTACSGGTATCMGSGVCTLCGGTYIPVDPSNHASQDTYLEYIDDEHHGIYHACCKAEKMRIEHTAGQAATCTGTAICADCGIAYGATDAANHTGELEYISNGKQNHIQIWDCCRTPNTSSEPHTLTYTAEGMTITGVCDLCGASGTVTLEPSVGGVYNGYAYKSTYDGTGLLGSWDAFTKPTISYCCGESGCKKVGTHTVTMTLGNQSVSADFTITQKTLTVSCVEAFGKSYDGTGDIDISLVDLDGIVVYDSGDYDGAWDDIRDDVELDRSNMTFTISGVTPGVYETVDVAGVALTGNDAANYIIAESFTAVPLESDYGWEFSISNCMIWICAENQTVTGDAELDQSAYTIEGLDDKFTIEGIALYENYYSQVEVDSSNIKITLDGEDVTAYFDISTRGGILSRVCEGHEYDENGFCATGECSSYRPAVKSTTVDEWGGEIEVYEIYNAGQLYWFAEQINTYGNNYINGQLMADITVNEDLTAENLRAWTPIGSAYPAYCAAFDGNGFTVSGLYVNDPEADYVGFFGGTDYSYPVTDLHLTNSFFAGNSYVGAMFGYAGSSINGCTVSDTVTVQGHYNVGGFAGGSSYGELTNSWSAAKVIGIDDEDQPSYSIGGLVGNNCLSINNCYTTGSSLVGTNVESYGGSVNNSYYLSEEQTEDGGKTAAQFASGEVAYLLQSDILGEDIYDDDGNWIGTAEPELIWGQDIGEEAYPVLKGSMVYEVRNCKDEIAYSNTNISGHTWTNATCTAPKTCTTCGSTDGEELGHSYTDGICGTCGEVDPDYVAPVVKPTLTLKAPALEFKDMIKVIAFFTVDDMTSVEELGMITYTEKVDVVDINTADHVIPGADYEESSKRYFASSQGIHAKYLGDTVYLACYAKLTDGTYVYTKLAPYSPITYATNQLKNSTDMKLKKLVAAMLNYGSEAQLYFGHNVDALANAGMTAEQLALPEAYRADMVGSVPAVSATKQGIFANNKGFTVRKPAISFEGAFSINYFFTPAYAPVDGIALYYWNESDFNAADVLTVENASGSIAMDGEGMGQYRGDITGISAKDLSKAVYVAAVYSDGTTTWTSGVLGYSIGAYCSNQSNTGSTIAALAEATAVYGYHAKQYFG